MVRLSVYFFCLINFFAAQVFCSNQQECTISLEVDNCTVVAKNENNEPSEVNIDAANGFLLIVQVSKNGNFGGMMPELEIPGMREHFYITGESNGTSNINNYRTIISKEIYLKPKHVKPGSFSLGPIKLKTGKETILGPSLKVNSKELKSTEYFARLELDYNQLFVWQQVPLKLKIYYNPQMAKGFEFENPNIPDFDIVKVNTEETTETFEDKSYQVLVVNYLITPKKTGSFELPAQDIGFWRQVGQSDRKRQMVNDFFGIAFGDDFSNWAKGVLRSNSINLEVVDLPKSNKNIKGIGSFEKFELFLPNKQEVCQVGEPVILGLALEGLGNFESIVTPELSLPAEAKCYPSKSSIKKIKNKDGKDICRKEFEYICQFRSNGQVEIAPQSFDYFDPLQKMNSSLQSNNLKVTVIDPFAGKNDSVQNVDNSSVIKNKETEINEPTQPQKEEFVLVQPIAKKSWLAKSVALPNWLFFFVLFLMIVVLVVQSWMALAQKIYQKKYLLKLSLLKLAKIRTNQEYEKIYLLLQFYFSIRLGIAEADLDLDILSTELRNKLIEKQVFNQQEWGKFLDFYTECQALCFGTKNNNFKDQEKLLVEVQDWLLYFDKILR